MSFHNFHRNLTFWSRVGLAYLFLAVLLPLMWWYSLPMWHSLPLQLQSDLDQEYQDKFRRLPVEIQEFVQDSSKAKLSDDCVHGNLVSSSTAERLNHKASQSEDDMEEGSSERVYDTPL